MQKLVWQNANGDSIDLTSGNYGITEWEGFSNTSLNIQSQQVPFQDGAVFLDALLNQRELSVTLKMQDNGNLEERYRMRRELIHILNPKLGEGYLIYTNDFISKRIKCVAQIPLFETHNSDTRGTPKASLSWTACEPYWEDLEETVVQMNLETIKTINNEGDVPANVKINFMAENASYPRIVRTSKNRISKIAYNGTLSGMLEIKTNSGEKGANLFNLNFKTDLYLNNYKAVVYCLQNSHYYSITDNKILSSIDFVKWEAVAYSSVELNKIYYIAEKSLIIALGKNGYFLTSYDGVEWTEHNVGSNHNLLCFCYFSGTYIIGGFNFLATSSDLKIWTFQETNLTARDIIYVEELQSYFAVGQFGVRKSSDLLDWVVVSNSNDIESIIYSKQIQKLYCVGASTSSGTPGVLMSSEDGVDWSLENIGTYPRFNKISELNNNLIIIGANGNILTSEDGTNWNSQSSVVSSVELRDLLFRSDIKLYEIVGTKGTLLVSNDLINWQNKFIPIVDTNLNKIAYSEEKNIYVTVGISGTILKSNDLINWEKVSGITGVIKDIIYVKKFGKFFAVGGNKIYRSEDGVNWTGTTIGATDEIFTIIYSEVHNIFIIGGGYNNVGNILTSEDGINWVERFYAVYTNLRISDIIFENNKYVAVGFYGLISTSEDGINWTSRTVLETYQTLNSVTYLKEKDLYVAVGNRGTILTSSNLIDWVSHNFDTSYNLNGVDYSEKYNITFAVGTNGFVLKSNNGVDWVENEYITSQTLFSITYIKELGEFFLTGGTGTLLQSIINYTENQIQNITTDSDFNFNLLQGKNELILSAINGDVNCSVSYRQKYIGV